MQIQGRYMPLNEGHKLHVVTSGSESAPPLLMLHCWTGNWTQWQPTMQHLDRQFRFIVPDQFGFGASPKPAGEHYQIDVQAERARQIVRDLGYDKVSIIGHSMGGMIGLTFAGMFPDMVDKLIVVDPAVTGKTHPLTSSLAKFLNLGRMGFVQPLELTIELGQRFPVLGAMLMKVFFAHPHKFPEAVQYWGNQAVADGQVYASVWAEKAITQWDTRPLFGITAKTLAIWGELDFTIPISECDVLDAHIANFEALRIPDIGHFPMIEAWEVYSQTISDFLSN